ncbi:MAG TPA: family 20 glycosylhydrolase, partial [Anseongella sp.]|nr:family 20 glycosylhydrolase [Anseongella sp.]
GGLAPGATVMSWRGMSGGIKSAKMGHPVIMTPNEHCYLDLYQGDPAGEPPTYSMLRLTDSYHFNPVPEGVDPSLILGGQGNLWTESVPNPRHAEYMTWPRGLALAEVFWSPQERRNWNDFIQRMEAHFRRFDAAEVNYSRSAYDPIVTPRWSPDKKELLITLSTEIPGMDIFYTFDGTWPDKFLDQYLGEALKVPRDADTFRVVTYKDGKPAGKTLSYKISELYGKLPAPM